MSPLGPLVTVMRSAFAVARYVIATSLIGPATPSCRRATIPVAVTAHVMICRLPDPLRSATATRAAPPALDKAVTEIALLAPADVSPARVIAPAADTFHAMTFRS